VCRELDVSLRMTIVTYDEFIHTWCDSGFLRSICLSRTLYVITHHKLMHMWYDSGLFEFCVCRELDVSLRMTTVTYGEFVHLFTCGVTRAS